MDRKDLDRFIAHHELSPQGVAATLEIAQAQPSRPELVHFLVQMLRVAGVLSLAAGLVFFVAANWQQFRVFGRFALIECILVVSIAFAVWRPAPAPLGRYALLMAFIATGALLALFGQTYQTGADVYELFLTWTLIGLPFVIAAQWSGTWGAWLTVLNVALVLFCSVNPGGGRFWSLFDGRGVNVMELLLLPAIVNLGLWALTDCLRHTRWRSVAAPWLGRLAFASAVAFGTWSSLLAILQADRDIPSHGAVLPSLLLIACALGSACYVVYRRRDVFPLAALVASLIVLTTAAWAKHGDFGDTGTFFVLSSWLIVTSTVSGRMLMKLVREWQQPQAISA